MECEKRRNENIFIIAGQYHYINTVCMTTEKQEIMSMRKSLIQNKNVNFKTNTQII